MKHSSFDTTLELKFLAETGVFEGYASVFNVTDSVNDRILPGAFRESLEKFRQDGRFPPLLWQHDTAEPIGLWHEMYEDSHGLFVKGALFVSDLARAKEAHKLLQEGVVTGLSIGYRVKESRRDQKSGVRILTQVELLEVSLVTFPANAHARVTGVKKFSGRENIPTARELESFLQGAGLSRKQAKGVVAKGYKGLLPREDAAAGAAAVTRFRETLVRATEDNKKAVLAQAFPVEKKEAGLQEALHRFSSCLRQATAENLKAGYNSAQPRAPRGSAGGGQWTETGRGAAAPAAPPSQKPRSMDDLRRYEGDGLGHPLSPLDFIGGGAAARLLKPAMAEATGGIAAARNAARLTTSGIPKEKLTDHGGLRIGEHAINKKDIEEAIRTAKETGNVTTKLGKYNTPQHIYKGSNGVTVHIETQGRNAGKVITTYGKNPGGKR